ncbi:Growth factor receptor-bound protein [Ooceraea biroi]|uniref:Growth factor receptor-bound protein n=1 Tax=Ooceraea biroi TaxID=2015173 RepID=A0A026X2C5_OOCBI|nr:Growth factor receptor-bound protein [Ooceraea biroi]
MDFTGSVGRIVEDPKEAKDIAENEGIIWRRRWRPFSRTPPGCAMVRLHGLDGGIHVLQPWFHGGLKREVAAAIIRDHGSVDGVFLVRESKSNPGAYVLTYKYSDKIFHAQIQPVFDERRNCWLYTLDKGATKFYDLLQLIEFYQLNAGSLPTRLTHYVQNGVQPSVSRPEDGGASPSPPESGSQRVSSSDKAAEPRRPAGVVDDDRLLTASAIGNESAAPVTIAENIVMVHHSSSNNKNNNNNNNNRLGNNNIGGSGNGNSGDVRATRSGCWNLCLCSYNKWDL